MTVTLRHRGGRGQGFVHELLYDGQGQDGEPFVMGLVDVETLRASLRRGGAGNIEGVAANFESVNADVEGRSSPHRGAIEPGVSGADRAPFAQDDRDLRAAAADRAEIAHLDGAKSAAAYVHAPRSFNDASSLAAEAAR